MIKTLALILSMIMLSACEIVVNDKQESWKHASENYTCDNEQFREVMFRVDWCTKQSDFYRPGYCYGTAIMNVCTKKVKELQ